MICQITNSPKLDFSWIDKTLRSESLAVDIDFYKLFHLVKKEYDSCYFFESLSLPRHQDRYHVIGFAPVATFSAKDQNLTIESEEHIIQALTGIAGLSSVTITCVNPYKVIADAYSSNMIPTTTHQGGLIGYFSHESINYFEDSIHLAEHTKFDTFKLGLYLDGLIYDTTTNTLSYYTLGEDRSQQVLKLIEELNGTTITKNIEEISFLGHGLTKEEYISAVERTRHKIIEGYSFQSEVGFKSEFLISGNKIAVYNKLREINPSPYMYYLKFGKQELFGASPEILVACKQRIALTTPTAGTTTRGKTKAEDISLARALLNDPKEISEHNMLVDLHRNDLARVSKAGSVRVSDLMYIIEFSHVQHIVSQITSELSDNMTSFDLLASVLPGGVTTGAPKIETIKIISETEKTPRGPYGGAVGRFSFNGDCDFCLPIRSIFCDGDVCFSQTSAGIVYDSNAEKEYNEVKSKLAALIQTLEELGGEFHDQ